jgi:hypothetical protein
VDPLVVLHPKGPVKALPGAFSAGLGVLPSGGDPSRGRVAYTCPSPDPRHPAELSTPPAATRRPPRRRCAPPAAVAVTSNTRGEHARVNPAQWRALALQPSVGRLEPSPLAPRHHWAEVSAELGRIWHGAHGSCGAPQPTEGGPMPPDDAVATMKQRRFLRRPEQVTAARQFVTEALARGSEFRETARLRSARPSRARSTGLHPARRWRVRGRLRHRRWPTSRRGLRRRRTSPAAAAHPRRPRRKWPRPAAGPGPREPLGRPGGRRRTDHLVRAGPASRRRPAKDAPRLALGGLASWVPELSTRGPRVHAGRGGGHRPRADQRGSLSVRAPQRAWLLARSRWWRWETRTRRHGLASVLAVAWERR